MDTYTTNARIAGVLFIIATVAGILMVGITQPILDDPEYLTKIAENPNPVRFAVLLQFIMAFAGAGIAIWLYPALKKHHEALALGAAGFRGIEAGLFCVSAAGLLTLISLSQEYTLAGTVNASLYETLAASIQTGRGWLSSVASAIAFCLGALLYYVVFFQSRLIPRWLSGWGFIGVIMHLLSVVLVIFGAESFSPITLLLNLPILLNELVLAVWLIVRGFNTTPLLRDTGSP